MASLYDSDIFLRWGFEGPRPLAAYIHVPFCHHRCGYCNFSVVANREDLIQRYIDAVLIELSRLGTEQSVKTVFLGGGTPSILPREAMARLLEGVRRWLPIETGGEWSIEANPLDVTHENLKLWSSLGINRISLGGQSFQARKLMVLERDHSPEQLSRSIHVAAEWLRNVSLDLIFAAPEETLQEWEKDLALVLEHPLKHVSTYGLTYEKGARFWSELHRNRLQRVDEEVELAMYEAAIDTLSAGGIEQYEVSNFAVPGWECVHNQAYWNGDRWWGFGPSAAGYLGKTRCVNHRSTLEYIRRIERGTSAVAEVDTLSEDQQWRERFVFGMRRRLGVPWSQWRERVPKGTRELIDRGIASHLASGWLEVFEDRVRLTRAGLVVSDGLWHAYLDGEV